LLISLLSGAMGSELLWKPMKLKRFPYPPNVPLTFEPPGPPSIS